MILKVDNFKLYHILKTTKSTNKNFKHLKKNCNAMVVYTYTFFSTINKLFYRQLSDPIRFS